MRCPRYRQTATLGLAAIIAVAAIAIFPRHAFASSKTWIGGSSGNIWSAGANWSGGTAPVGGQTLDFPVTANKTMTDDLGTLSFDFTFEDSGYSINASGGSTITLDGDVTNSSTGLNVFNIPVLLTGTRTITDSNVDGTTEFSGVISDGGSDFALHAVGPGTLSLAGANTFSGGVTTASAAIVSTDNDSALGTGVVTIASGSELMNTLPDTTIANALHLAGTGTGGTGAIVDDSASGNTTFSGPITLTGNAAVGSDSTGSTVHLTGNIGDGGGGFTLTFSAAGTATPIDLSGTNTYSGGTDITSGFVLSQGPSSLGSGAVTCTGGFFFLDGTGSWSNDLVTNDCIFGEYSGTNTWAGTITLNGSTVVGNVTASGLILSGVISGSGFMGVGGAPGAGVILTGSSANTNTGGIEVNGSLLTLDKAANVVATAGPITIDAGYTLVFGNDNQLDGTPVSALEGATIDFGGTAQSIAALSLTGATVVSDGAAMLETGDVSVPAATTAAIIGTVYPGGGTTTLTAGTHDFTVVRGTGTLDLTINAVIAGSGLPIFDGGGIVELNGDNTYTGATAVSGATTLYVNGAQPSSSVHATASSVLGGTGTMGNATLTSSALSPGVAGPGALAMGSATLDSDSALNIDLNGTTAGSQYDQVMTSGTPMLGDAALSITLGYTPAFADSFTILNNTSGHDVIGTFAGHAEGSEFTVDGHLFFITYHGGTSGHDIVLTVVIPVPDTGSVSNGGRGDGSEMLLAVYPFSLILFAGVALFCRGRKRRFSGI